MCYNKWHLLEFNTNSELIRRRCGKANASSLEQLFMSAVQKKLIYFYLLNSLQLDFQMRKLSSPFVPNISVHLMNIFQIGNMLAYQSFMHGRL